MTGRGLSHQPLTMFARVVLPLSRFDAFTYRVPSDLIGRRNPGAFVTVPFRRGTAIGVVAVLEPVTDSQGKIKPTPALRAEPAARRPADKTHPGSLGGFQGG